MMTAVSDTNALPRERRRPLRWLFAQFGDRMPKGLYARALIIIIAPMVLLQSVVTFVFLERHWQTVTHRLSTGTVQNISMLIDLYEEFPKKQDVATLTALAQDNLIWLRTRRSPSLSIARRCLAASDLWYASHNAQSGHAHPAGP